MKYINARLFMLLNAFFATLLCTSCCFFGVCVDPQQALNLKSKPIHDFSNSGFNDSTGTSSQPAPAAPSRARPGYPLHSTILAGPNISFKSSEEENTYGGKHEPGVGFQAGMGTTWSPSEKFTLFSALMFKQQNAAEKYKGYVYEPGGTGSTSDEKDKYQFNYLSVPLLAMYNITRDKSLSAGGGPELNYLLNGNLKPAEGEKEKINDQLVKVGFGLQAVVRYNLPSKTPKSGFAVQLAYDHRLSRLNKKEVEGFEAPAWRMKSVQLSLMYNFCKCQ